MASNTHPYHMGTYHMANDSNFEPQRNNNFEVQITGLGTDGKAITLAVATYAAPSITQTVIEVPYGNNRIKFAGTPAFSDSSIVLNDFIGQEVEKKLSNWQKKSYNYSDQTVGLAKDYKKTCYLIEYDPSGNTPRAWKLIGCWLSGLNLGDFSQEGNSVRQVTATLTYDYAIPETYGSSLLENS